MIWSGTESLNTGSAGYVEYKKKSLSKDATMIRVRIIPPFEEFFDAWVPQQPSSAIESKNFGKNRKIISAGYYQNPETKEYVYKCPLAKLLNSWRNETNVLKKKCYDDWYPRRQFAFNCIPQNNLGTEIDPWCVSNKHAQLLITGSESSDGIGITLFKAIAQAIKVYKSFVPDARLQDVDMILSRSGSGTDTKYAAQVAPTQCNIDIKAYQLYDLKQLAKLTTVEEMESITQIGLQEHNYGQKLGASFEQSQETLRLAEQAKANGPFVGTVSNGPGFVSGQQPASVVVTGANPTPLRVVGETPRITQPHAEAPVAARQVVNTAPAVVAAAPVVVQKAEVVQKDVLVNCSNPQCGVTLSIPASVFNSGLAIECPSCRKPVDTVPF